MACSKKIIFVLFSVFFMLFVFSTTVRAEWDANDIAEILNSIATVTGNQGVIISQLQSMGVDVTDCEIMLNRVNDTLKTIKTDTSNINNNITTMLSAINSINNSISNIYNKLDSNQKQLIDTLKSNNDLIQSQLNDLKNLLIGGETETQNVNIKPFSFGNLTPSLSGSGTYRLTSSPINVGYTTFVYTFEKGYTYDFVRTSGTHSGSSRILGTMDNVIAGGNSFYLTFLYDGSIDNATFSFTPKKSGTLTIVVNNPTAVSGSVFTITKKASGSLSNINNTISQGNQLQQQQNQLQQQQNDFLKNDNVSSDGSNLPSDNTQDITEDGFNSIFNKIYAAFTSNSSNNLIVTIPFTNKSFTISADTVYGSANLGLVKTLMQAFWYFVISYFIVKDIGKKINKIKSGDIEHVQEDNIKEDML